MPAIHGLGLSVSTLTVTFNAGTINGVRVNSGSEAFTAAAGGKFKRSLLVVSTADPGVVSEVTGVDADTLAAASAPVIAADTIVLAIAEVDDTNVTNLDLSAAGDVTAVSATA